MSKLKTNSSISHSRCNVLGVKVSAIDMGQAIRLADAHIQAGSKGYICVTGVHGIMEAQKNSRLLEIFNRSLMTTPDGMPTVWVGRLQGHRNMRRVYGPDFMFDFCSMSVSRGYRHFLYGGNPGIAELLAGVLTKRFPGIQIVGTYTPPYRPLNLTEEQELRELVSATKPDVIWVGLSSPKQDQFMAEYLERLDTRLMVGVGAAFDIHTGKIADAPSWVKLSGMQWFHRLCQEPRRLWKRYLINIPKFLWRIALQLLGLKTFSADV